MQALISAALELAPETERGAMARAACSLDLREVRAADGPDFAAVYSFLEAEFGPTGGMEPPEALAAFVRNPLIRYSESMLGRYHLIAAWQGGELVGARDCYVDVDLEGGTALVSLSHCLVAPAWRRRGLAALLRSLPLALAAREVPEMAGRTLPTLVVAEMDPLLPEEEATRVRLLAYGRSGYSVLDPARLPYAQPEFREGPQHRRLGMPFLGVVRCLGVPEAEGDSPSVPAELAWSFPRFFHATHRRYARPERVEACEQNAWRAFSAQSGPVALLPLPRGPSQEKLLEPFEWRRLRHLWPEELWGEMEEEPPPPPDHPA